MKVLIIYTHPHRESLNGSFLDSAISGLKENSRITEMEVLDLYAEGFDPLLIFNEEKRRRDMYLDPALEKYRQQILKADLIVCVYPIWWGRPPAMLLGYIDKIFATNFAFRYEPGKIMPKGLLEGKEVICFATMKGPSGYLQLFLNNAHQVLMKKALFNFVGIKKVKIFEFGDMEKKNGAQAKNLRKVRQFMARWQPSQKKAV